MSYGVTIQGIDELMAKIDPIRGNKWVKGGMESVGLELVGKAQQYPPVPAGSTYERTNKLRNSWTYQVNNDGDAVKIGSSEAAVPYNRYVMDRDMQTKVHAWHGWKTIQGILQMNAERVTEIMRMFLQRALK